MQLNRELLAKFVGGDMEIVRDDYDCRNTVFRGPIKGVEFKKNGWLKVKFFWLARAQRNDDWPNSHLSMSTWTKCKRANLSIPPMDFSECSGGVLHTNHMSLNFSTTLYPPRGEQLDQARIAGL